MGVTPIFTIFGVEVPYDGTNSGQQLFFLGLNYFSSYEGQKFKISLC